MSRPTPWEHGSDFDWPVLECGPPPKAPWTGNSLWITARAAWQQLVLARGWRTVWIPSYFCHDVSLATRETGARVVIYRDDPRLPQVTYPPVADQRGEALLVVNTFGCRRPPAEQFRAEHCELVEDHSHDPLSRWAGTSSADWCLASLRKTLPIPVGGVVWSPPGRPVPTPAEVSNRAARLAGERLVAMALKRLYLAGLPVKKAEFRGRFTATEADLGSLTPCAAPPSAEALLAGIPVAAWRERRRSNLTALAELLAPARGLALLTAADPEAAALGAVAVFENPDVASTVETALIEGDVYPARLWPLADLDLDLPAQSIDLASRTLFLHCDGRYAAGDLERVARTVLHALERTP